MWLRRRRVFVVEDEASIAIDLQTRLEDLGFEVVGVATRAEAALAEIPRARPELLLVDAKLGAGPSGIELVERLGAGLDLAIVFVTAETDTATLDRLLATRPGGLLTKPFSTAALLAQVRLALQHHQALRAHHAGERHLRDAQILAGIGSWSWDVVRNTTCWSDNLYGLFGVSREHFDPNAYEGFLALVHPDDRAGVASTLASARESGEPFRIQYRIVRPDGVERTVEARGCARFDGGVAVSVDGSTQDVTERARAARATLESELRYRTLFEEVLEGLCVSSIDGTILDANPAFARMVGAAGPGELIGTSVLRLWADPAERARLQDRHMAGGVLNGVRATFRTVGGERVRVELSGRLLADERGAPDRYVTHVRDVTAEEEHAATLEAVFEGAPDALLMVSRAGRILRANRTATEVLGYDAGELCAMSVEDLVPPEHRALHAAHRESYERDGRRRAMGWARSRLWAVRKDGRRVPVEISLSPLTVEGGPPIVIAALRDVSARLAIEEERARLEDQLRHAQKMESIGTLASGIAHDFNNLLAIAAINLELLRSQLPPSAAALAPIDDIAVAHRRAADLVKQILAFGRRQPSQRVRVSLTALVHEATRLMRATLPATVTLRADVEPMPELLVDATQIHQVLMNLATNAWHALAGNPGHIDIEGRLVVLDEETQPAPGMSTGAYARLDVRDDGTGMTEATRARVFEPFFSTKGVGGGSGLGLSVAHGVVTAHGGAITVQSTLGGGTTFSVFLPLAPLDAEAEDGRETPPMLRRPTLDARVLLVDDELSLTRATRGMLEQLGCTVTSHVRSHDALADLRLDPARFDVVITDQHMPEIGGLDLARALEAIRPDLPVILVSGNQSMVADREVGPNVRTRLEKPYTMHALRETIAKVMDTRAHG